MQVTINRDLQAKFFAGLQICGEEDGKLLWIGTGEQMDDAEALEMQGVYPDSFISAQEQEIN